MLELTVFAVSKSIPLLFNEFESVMRRGWRLRSCGTAMDAEPPKAGMLLANEVVVVVLVPEVDDNTLLLNGGKDEGKEVGNIPKLVPSLGLKLLCKRVVVVPAWVDVTVVPDEDARLDGANETFAPLTSWLFSPLLLVWWCSDVGVLSPEEISISAAPTS